MNPDQTAPKIQSALSLYCLQYRQPKYLGRREREQTSIVVNSMKRVDRDLFSQYC